MNFAELIANLRALNRFQELEFEGSYGIMPQVTPNWRDAQRRLLLVIESVDRFDLKAGRLLSDLPPNKWGKSEANPMRRALEIVLQHGYKQAAEYEDVDYGDTALGLLNFNAVKFYNLEGAPYDHALRKCATRATEAVKRLNPTDIIVFGDNASHFLLKATPYKDHLPWMRGVPHDCEVAGKVRRVTSTLDLETLYRTSDSEDDADSSPSDLLYYVSRHCAHALLGRHPHSLAHLRFRKYTLIRTIEEFDTFYEKLKAFPRDQPIGFDVEAAGLEAYTNVFFTHQYAFSEKHAYVIPLRHPITLGKLFTEEEVQYMEKRLRAVWASRKRRLFVGVNVQFDAKLVRAQFGIRFIHHTLWDIPAGEQLLDENLAIFNTARWRVGSEFIKTPQGNLAAILCAYGNDFYKTAAFSKADRMKFGRVDLAAPEGEDAVQYAAADAASSVAMYHAQHDRAAHIRISRDHCYDQWYHTHVSNQMSNTVHALSHMHQAGSPLDVEYLKGLMKPDSPLMNFRHEADAKLRTMDTVVATTRRIAEKAGIGKGGGVFGNAGSAVKSLFTLSKPDHKRTLFFDVMKLQPVKQTASGLDAVDKGFYEAYRDHWEEVQLAEDVGKADKLVGTFIKGWLTKLAESLDSIKDACLRPSFGFFDIVTGRLNSFKPNLQQVPSRGALAKYIKRAFVALQGGLLGQWDFSANEVRFAVILSADEEYAEVFRAGQRLRQELIQVSPKDTERIKQLQEDIETKGDVHIQAVYRFHGIWVGKKDPARGNIKSVVFGLIYGKSIRALGEDMRKAAVAQHMKAVIAAENKIKQLEKELAACC